MDWSLPGTLSGPFSMHPAKCVWSWYPNQETEYHVDWRFGQRYGVVTWGSDFKWLITWFDAKDIPLAGRTTLGGGAASFDLSKGTTSPLREDERKALGL